MDPIERVIYGSYYTNNLWTQLYNRNKDKNEQNILERHEKKLHNLTDSENLPFQSEEIITNLSSYTLHCRMKIKMY